MIEETQGPLRLVRFPVQRKSVEAFPNRTKPPANIGLGWTCKPVLAYLSSSTGGKSGEWPSRTYSREGCSSR